MSAVPGQFVLDLSCVLDAPSERVFKALTDPAELALWWGPAGFTTNAIELDLSVGGRYRFGMQPPDGELFHLAGEFREVDPPRTLAYTFRWEEPDPDDRETVVRLSLSVEAGQTTLSVSQGLFATEARLALHHQGWSDSFKRLSRHLESGASTRLSR